ncbi:MAG: thioredoxin [Phycisphaerales bacterium]|jgi:thioredoxin 1|nr:thioredoxin [Phycisphaerales bacterium]
MASEHVHEFTDSNFESEVLKSSQPVLVDFWAEWCMPCRMLSPTIDQIAAEFSGRAKVGKVDTDSNRDISLKYGISAIPTVLLFKDGQLVKKFVGLTGKDELASALATAAG